MDAALIHEDSRIFRFLVIADAHQKNDNEAITASTKELGQAVGEVLRQIGVDFVANLGDITWGSSESSSETVLEEAKTFNKLFSGSIRGETQIWTEGNHETDKLTDSQISAVIYSRNKGLTQDADHWIEGYGYLDFHNQKVRVICLNTNQATGSDASGVSDSQLKWFAETALNMEGKSDWGVITLGHHPLGYSNVTLFKNCATVLEAFLSGSVLNFTTNGSTTLSVDYSNKNCQYIGHFHGHVHTYTMLPILKYISSGVYEKLDAWEVCIPNACASRTDQYYSLEDTDYLKRYYIGGIDYNRPETDGQRTAFTLVTVCLDEKKIYADDYGIVPPNVREVSFDFTKQEGYINQIPISTDADGSIYNGVGYKENTYLSSGNDGTRSGIETVGFIPFDTSADEFVIYLSGVTCAASDANCRICFYNPDKTYIQQFTFAQFDTNGYNIPILYETDDNGNVVKIDCTDMILDQFKDHQGKTVGFFRLCATQIDGNSIITLNSPIV